MEKKKEKTVLPAAPKIWDYHEVLRDAFWVVRRRVSSVDVDEEPRRICNGVVVIVVEVMLRMFPILWK